MSVGFTRDIKFLCGLLTIGKPGDSPDWTEFKNRIDFVRNVYGLRITCLEAFDDKGIWTVPFFTAQANIGNDGFSRSIIEANTPYKISVSKGVNPAHVDAETLRILARVVEQEVPSWWINEVIPKPKQICSDPENIFKGLVGMEKQKATLMKLAKAVAVCGKESIDCFHFVFTGNPGTGKTELASRLITYLDLLGITDGTRRFIKVGEADLIGKYVGHTAPRVKKAVEAAMGGLLFIDEFYSLATADAFGQQAIDELTNQLDAHRHDVVCVVAGYRKEVEAVLDLNRGLSDRFGYRIDFPDFNDEELVQIFKENAAKRGFVVKCNKLERAVAKLRNSHSFSNARSVRRLIDHAICNACWNHEDEKSIDDNDLLAALRECLPNDAGKVIGFVG